MIQLSQKLAIEPRKNGGDILWDGKAVGTYRKRGRAVVTSITDASAERAWQRLCSAAQQRLQLLAQKAAARRDVDTLYPAPAIVLEWAADLRKLKVTWRQWRLVDFVDLDHGMDPDAECKRRTDDADSLSFDAYCKRESLA